ncbi:MAG TPA: cytochrome c peroxidase [Burkholderiaceae bacterium]|jgi:cytochrome c peroxidase
MRWSWRALGLAFLLLSVLAACERAQPEFVEPAAVPAATLVELGKLAFFDPSLSASGRQSCASCHSPAHAYGPPNGLAVQLGGPELKDAGTRAVPSLRYLRRTPIWFKTTQTSLRERLTDTDNVPTGGFTWDGRFNTLAQQARAPLLAPNEMANASEGAVVQRLAASPNAQRFREVFGADIFARPEAAFAALAAALQRFQLDDPSFQPFSSKFDRYLDGKAELDAREQRGLKLFNDPNRGNCASCHIVQPGANGAHPLFTDFGFQALGVPRNPEIPANAKPDYFDLGLCGPVRTDQRAEKSYCGNFKTPSLRNVATRGAFFHNGRFHTLEEALHFYVERDTSPQHWYPHADGQQRFDDLPAAMQDNVNRRNAPMTNERGARPVWSDADIADVVAFLKTLSDAP